jgi:hypothetical protein
VIAVAVAPVRVADDPRVESGLAEID